MQLSKGQKTEHETAFLSKNEHRSWSIRYIVAKIVVFMVGKFYL